MSENPVHSSILYMVTLFILYIDNDNPCPNHISIVYCRFLVWKISISSETFDLDLTAIPSEDALADNAEYETEAERKTTCSVVSDADSDSSADVDGDTEDGSELDSDSELEEEFEFLSQDDLWWTID